ncbi:MAG: lamin tail domain-containing protein [Myxococcales bacterium]|nr:lamin tail domain-containing protein [Myxococcales bacterium]
MRRLAALCLALAACDDPGGAVDAGVDAGLDAQVGQGSEPTGDLVINEVAPRGVGSDWVELHNRGATPIDLCGYFLTDAADRLDHYLPLGGVLPPAPCPPLPLAPGAYRVILLDGTPLPTDTPIDPLHAPFKLGVADQVHLVTTAGGIGDGVLFLYPRGPAEPADVALARVPDGGGLFFAVAPSAGAANPAVLP